MCLTGIEAKRKLYAQKKTVKQWAEEHGYSPRDVSDVIRGVNRAKYGRGYEIAVKLGMQDNDGSVKLN